MAEMKVNLENNLPKGVLGEDKKIDFEALLRLFQIVYEHNKEIETLRYFDLLAKRHYMHVRKNKDKDKPFDIDNEYLELIVQNISHNHYSKVKLLEHACEVFNREGGSPVPLNATMLQKFTDMARERNDDFRQMHGIIV